MPSYKETQSRHAGRIAEGCAMAKHQPWRQYGLMSSKMTQGTTQFGIIDRTVGRVVNGVPKGEWLMRFDGPHGGAPFYHLNLNTKLTGFPDPHTRLPGSVITGAGKAGKALRYVGKGALIVSLAVDTCRVAEAIYDDVKKKRKVPKSTIHTGSSVAGGVGGGIGGAAGGSSFGAWVGGAVGACFGGVGAVPGAAIGSLIGGVIGGIGGSMAGSAGVAYVAEQLIDEFCSDSEDEDE